MDIAAYNRDAWTNEVLNGNKWTLPVTSQEIEQARSGEYSILLTPTKPVPKNWIGDVSGKKVLCLASGGGQQGPVFAALGAVTVVLDNCPAQLERDELVAKRDGLNIRLEGGDMRDLSRFEDETFDMIFNPVSNCFIDDLAKVQSECYRVLKKGGALLTGFCNPLLYIFDIDAWNEGKLLLAHKIPYSDVEQLTPDELKTRIELKETFDFGHSLEQQIGGLVDTGFVLTGLFEDNGGGVSLLDPFIDTFMAIRAVKP